VTDHRVTDAVAIANIIDRLDTWILRPVQLRKNPDTGVDRRLCGDANQFGTFCVFLLV
jgi:hypothetical protein